MDGTGTEIAKVLHLSKQLLSYHINKAIKLGYVEVVCRDTFKPYELTQPGKNFLAMYQNNKVGQQPTITKLGPRIFVLKHLYTRCHPYL